MEFLEDKHLELYNLEDDISELKNLATEQAAKAAELHALMLAWRERVKAPMPTSHVPVAEPTNGKGKRKKMGKGKKRASAE